LTDAPGPVGVCCDRAITGLHRQDRQVAAGPRPATAVTMAAAVVFTMLYSSAYLFILHG
jgi:uncharacterized membrane protein YhiD involved in acid resistance